MRKAFLYFIFVFTFFVACQNVILACDTCGCVLARCPVHPEMGSEAKNWFFDFSFEQLNWDKKPADAAHEFHDEGRHFHDKTHEEFYHFSLGANPMESFTILTEIPYVVRHSLEIEDHDRLGEKEVAEGIGDLKLTGIYRFLKNPDGFLGVAGGVKFPTGGTRERNSQGVRFEAELQPGSGSDDYTIGAAFGQKWGRIVLQGNALYTFKTKGDQEFEFGDLFAMYLFLDYAANDRMKIGLDMNLQIEEEEKGVGAEIADSGGTTLLLGPALTIEVADNASIFGNVLFPVYQNLGGVHQELDFAWNAGAKISF